MRCVVVQALQQRLRVGEVRGQDLPGDREQLEDPRVADAVEDARSLPAALEQPLFSKHAKVLRGAARVEGERCLEFPDRAFAVLEQFEDTDTRGMPEDAEEFTLEGVDRMVARDQCRPFIEPSVSHAGCVMFPSSNLLAS